MDAETLNTAATGSATGASIHPLVPASMEIVCGTDFSKSAVQAADAAAALASRLREPLIILHAFDEPSRLLLPKELRDSLRTFEQQQLQDEAQRLTTGATRADSLSAVPFGMERHPKSSRNSLRGQMPGSSSFRPAGTHRLRNGS